MTFEYKYLKYKRKYLELKYGQYGGNESVRRRTSGETRRARQLEESARADESSSASVDSTEHPRADESLSASVVSTVRQSASNPRPGGVTYVSAPRASNPIPFDNDNVRFPELTFDSQIDDLINSIKTYVNLGTTYENRKKLTQVERDIKFYLKNNREESNKIFTLVVPPNPNPNPNPNSEYMGSMTLKNSDNSILGHFNIDSENRYNFYRTSQ